MMDEIERTPQETTEGREGAGESERSALNDATLDPGAFIEQSSEFQQAEALSTAFTALVEASNTETLPTMAEVLPMESGVLASEEEEQSSQEDAIGVEIGSAGAAAEGDTSGRETGSAGAAAEGDASGRETGSVGAAAEGDASGRETGSAGAAAEGDASGRETGSAGAATEGDASGTITDREGTETGGGSVITGTLEISAIPLEETIPADLSQMLEGEVINAEEQLPADASESPADASTSETEEGQEGTGEADEGWNPPDMYANVDSYGNITVVDADGKPIDCPPMVTKVAGDKGETKYLASYQAGGKTYSFEISSYVSSLSDLYVGYDQDGNITVVNGQGEKIDAPPVITKFIDDKGEEKYTAAYLGVGSGVVLEGYKAPLENCYAHIGQDGKVTIVDADGNPLTCQPVTYKYVDDKGVEQVSAYYQGTGEGGKLTLASYSTSLENCYVNYGMDGKVTVVDADGNPLASQPLTYKYMDAKGMEQVSAYYPGTGDGGKLTLASYSTSLENCYVNYGMDGKVTVVDADGNPLASQPLTYKYMDAKGMEQVSAYYPGAGDAGKLTLASYTTSLENCFTYIGQDGKVIVVDADGKPLTSQPLTYKFVDAKGVLQVAAYYAGDQTKTTLGNYLPPSGTPKSTSQE